MHFIFHAFWSFQVFIMFANKIDIRNLVDSIAGIFINRKPV